MKKMEKMFHQPLFVVLEEGQCGSTRDELDLRFTMYKVQFIKLGGYAARGAKPSHAYRPRLKRGRQLMLSFAIFAP